MAGKLYVLIRPPERSHLSFYIEVEALADGAMRLHGYKAGVDLLKGVVRADGSFELLMLRDHAVVAGTLAELAEQAGTEGNDAAPVASFLAQLPRVADELRIGPVPRASLYRRSEDGGQLHLVAEHGDGLVSRLTVGNGDVVHKALLRGGEELLRLDYDRHLRKDGLYRAQKVEVRLSGDPTRIVIKMADWNRLQDPPPPEAPPRPEGWPVMDLRTFLDRVAAPE